MRKSIMLVAACLAVAGCERSSAPVAPPSPPASPPTVAVEAPEPAAKPTDAGLAIAQLDATITFHRKAVEVKKDWLHYESLANAHMSRARLTGSIDDYVAAGAALDAAFTVAVAGSGPFFTRASYNYTIHRNALVEPDLVADEKRLLRKVEDEANTAGLRGDLAMHRGELDQARALYGEAASLQRTAAAAGRLAFLDLMSGDHEAARKGYEEAAELAKGDDAQVAWALLHRGIVELELGDPAAALPWYEKANAAFSGWYLVEEHVAEAKLLLGEPDAAIAMYESILARTPSGEFMAAMAECWAAKGDEAKAREWNDKARAAFERDIAKLPSAASGHALEFYLGQDMQRALELARQNMALRPNHSARTQLAQALLATGDPEGAREVLRPVVGSAWAAPDFLATVAIAFEGKDDGVAKAASERAGKADPGAVAELRTQLGLGAGTTATPGE